MIEAILTNILSSILNEVFGPIFQQPMKRLLDEREMQRALAAAIKHAEERFSQNYYNIDAELTNG